VIRVDNTWQSSWSLRSETHKLILARDIEYTSRKPQELYDLTVDPASFTTLPTWSLCDLAPCKMNWSSGSTNG